MQLSHGFPFQVDFVSVVDQAIKDRISDGRIADILMPALDRQLGGHKGRGQPVPVFNDLEQIAAFLSIHGS